jgi:hypothetical protein
MFVIVSELDETYCHQLNFKTQLDVLQNILPDTLEEMRTVLLYEMANLELMS